MKRLLFLLLELVAGLFPVAGKKPPCEAAGGGGGPLGAPKGGAGEEVELGKPAAPPPAGVGLLEGLLLPDDMFVVESSCRGKVLKVVSVLEVPLQAEVLGESREGCS